MAVGDGDLLEYQPSVPDPVRAPTSVTAGAVAYVPAADRWGLDAVPWLPVYPDVVPGRGRRLDAPEGAFAYVPAINRWGLDAVPWLPAYPDVAPRGRAPLPVEALTSIGYVPALDRWGLDAMPWLPVYPDFARRAPWPTSPSMVAHPPWDTHHPLSWAPVAAPALQPGRRLPPLPVGALTHHANDVTPWIEIPLTASSAWSGPVVIDNFGLTRLVAGASGDVAGGAEVLIAGQGLDMRSVCDAFTDGVLGWTNVSTGDGILAEVVGGLDLRAGSGTAAARTTAGTTLDARVAVEVSTVVLGAAASVVAAGFGLVVDANNDLWLDLVVEPTRRYARVVARVAGGETFRRTHDLTPGVALSSTLRLLRAGGQVVVWVGGRELEDLRWLTTSAAPTVRVVGGTGATVRTRVLAYDRSVVVRFGGVPARLVGYESASRVAVRAPPADRPGTVTLTTAAADGAEVAVSGGFTYTIDDRAPYAGRAGSRTLRSTTNYRKR